MVVDTEGMHDKVDDHAAASADAGGAVDEHALVSAQRLKQQWPRLVANCKSVAELKEYAIAQQQHRKSVTTSEIKKNMRSRSAPASMSQSTLSSMGKLSVMPGLCAGGLVVTLKTQDMPRPDAGLRACGTSFCSQRKSARGKRHSMSDGTRREWPAIIAAAMN